MDWGRMILDGLMMSGVFNLATGLIMAVSPVTFTTSYPKQIQQAAPPNPTANRDKMLFSVLVILPVFLFGAISAWKAGVRGFWPLFGMGYGEWFLVNLGDFFGLDLYFREKMGTRLELPGTEGHPCYERKNWMKSLALPEHWIGWPFVICPLFAALAAGLGLLLSRI